MGDEKGREKGEKKERKKKAVACERETECLGVAVVERRLDWLEREKPEGGLWAKCDRVCLG